MSDSLQEVRALPEGQAKGSDEPHRLRGTARTPKAQPKEAAQSTHALAAGTPPKREAQNGSQAGGSRPRGPVEPHSAADIAHHAAVSQPGPVPFERQFGVQSVGVSAVPGEQGKTPDKRQHPRQGSMGDPGPPASAKRSKQEDE